MIIIKTPQPDIEERLVLVPVAGPGAPRDATPVDLERAGYVSREQPAPGTLAHLRADLRDMTARAEKAELDAAEWAAEVDALRAEALAELADARRERDTLRAELAGAGPDPMPVVRAALRFAEHCTPALEGSAWFEATREFIDAVDTYRKAGGK